MALALNPKPLNPKPQTCPARHEGCSQEVDQNGDGEIDFQVSLGFGGALPGVWSSGQGFRG